MVWRWDWSDGNPIDPINLIAYCPQDDTILVPRDLDLQGLTYYCETCRKVYGPVKDGAYGVVRTKEQLNGMVQRQICREAQSGDAQTESRETNPEPEVH